MPEFVRKHFCEHNFKVKDNPKVEVRIDDGRHFLMTTDQKFDGITSDPLDPWVKGAAALYTQEFFEAAKNHLTPGGVVTQFVQLYESTEEAVKSEIATFFEVFPNGSLFVNNVNGGGYDLVMLGQADATVIDVDGLTKQIGEPEIRPDVRSRCARSVLFRAQPAGDVRGPRYPILMDWLECGSSIAIWT